MRLLLFGKLPPGSGLSPRNSLITRRPQSASPCLRLVTSEIHPENRDGPFEVDRLFAGAPPPGSRRGQTLQICLELDDLTKSTLIVRGGFYRKTGCQRIYAPGRAGVVEVKRPIKLGRQKPQAIEVLEGLERTPGAVLKKADSLE